MINQDRTVRDTFVLGASAGGIEALAGILKRLPATLSATVGIVLHRSPTFESQLDRLLGRFSALPVGEPADGDPIKAGQVYVAPRDVHMSMHDERWRLHRGPKVHFSRPAIDPLFMSAAASRGRRAVGVLLSGGGSDGVLGLLAIKAADGLSIAQQPSEAQAPSMPRHAIDEDHVDAILRLDQIASLIAALAVGQSFKGSG
jgi:two-component system chemotaxis response regulator CheB